MNFEKVFMGFAVGFHQTVDEKPKNEYRKNNLNEADETEGIVSQPSKVTRDEKYFRRNRVQRRNDKTELLKSKL
jgi:hypothetical protein